MLSASLVHLLSFFSVEEDFFCGKGPELIRSERNSLFVGREYRGQKAFLLRTDARNQRPAKAIFTEIGQMVFHSGYDSK